MRKGFAELRRLLVERPLTVLACVALATGASLLLATRLELRTGFDSLLPESRPSVKELRRVEKRTASLSTIFVVLEGEDPAALRRAGDALVPALVQLGPPWVGEAADGVQDVIAFMRPREGLFASLDQLKRLRDQVEERFAYEVGARSGMLEGLDDQPPPPFDAATVKRELGVGDDPTQRFPGGYYQSADGKTLVVAVRCGVLSTDLARGEEALKKVAQVVERVNPRAYDPAVKWGLSGDLAIGIAEYRLVSRDLTEVGIVGAVLILGVVFLFYLRLRTLLAMGLTIAVGLSWTFGLTELALGHLNLATGFLFTIIGGNGVNTSIILMARYLEERRSGSVGAGAISRAITQTWHPTLTASAAAAASYGALVITEFKGFREFGVIGGAGMLICWLATYLTLPPLLVVMEKVLPLDRGRGPLGAKLARVIEHGVPFGRPFAWLVARAPRTLAVGGVALAMIGAVLTVLWVKADPMEYDFNRIQSDRRAVAQVHRLIGKAIVITGYVGLDGMAILTDRLDQVQPLKAALLARRDAAAPAEKPFKDVHALQDFVPVDQANKLPVLAQLKKRLEEARRRRLISDSDWAQLLPYLPPDQLKPFGIDELPEALARPFTEADGTRGRVVYISPLDGDVTSDAHYLRRWAASFRRTVLPDGSVIVGTGRAVIFADMWEAILSDVQPAVLASFAATLIIIALAFRRPFSALGVLGSLLVGVFWMAGALSLGKLKLNFLDFIALPITFGIGVDYAVNVMQRYQDLRDPIEVLKRTGGAVVLCSFTTLLGYLALVNSVNFGVRSLGYAAVAGEVACLLAAVLVLPAALLWLKGRDGQTQRALPIPPAPRPSR